MKHTSPALPKRPTQRSQRRRNEGRALHEFFEFECSHRYGIAALGGAAAGLLAIHTGGSAVGAALMLAGAAGLAYTTLIEPRMPTLERITLPLPGLPAALDGLRIGQLSDLHLGLLHTAHNTRWGVQQMLREQPDLLVITGDFVTLPQAIPSIAELLRPLHAPLGVYAVTGNHDYWEGVEEITAAARALGIEVLFNEHRRLTWRGAELWLAGTDDLWYGAPDLDATLHGIPPESFTLLLAHEPDCAPAAAHRGVQAQLSGHTHGGQIRLPLLGTFCLPRMGIYFAGGHYDVDGMQLYVSRGLGGMPVRFNCRPEAAIITLRHT